MKKSFYNPTGIAAAILLLSLPLPSFCETTEEAETRELEENEITAMRFGDSRYDVAASAREISGEDLSESGLVGIPDVLRRFADVYVRNFSGSPLSGDISIRGFGENSGQRVLVIMDGQRLNRLDMSPVNWGQILAEDVENIEVLKGSQTALYGNYAASGVVNIETKKWGRGSGTNFGGFFGTYGEYEAHGSARISEDDFYAEASANYYHDGGYIDNSLSWTKFAGLSGGIKPDSKNEITALVRVGNEFCDFPKPHSSHSDMENNPSYSDGSNSQTNTSYVFASASWKNHGDFGEGSSQLGFNLRDRDTLYPSMYGDSSNKNFLYTISFTPRYRLFLDELENSYIEGGVDFYYDSMNSEQYSDGHYHNKTADTEITRATIAPWAAGNMSFNEIFSASAAGRCETLLNSFDHDAADPFDNSDTLCGLAAQVGLNARLDESWNVYFRFDQLYRYPAADESAAYWGYIGDGFNPDLKPERGQNYEIGTNFSKGPWSANAAVFYMSLSDEISYDPYLYENRNIGDTDRYGAEVRLAYDAESFGASTSWTFVSAKFSKGSYDGNRVPLVPEIVSSTRVWVSPLKFLKLELIYQWTSPQYMGDDFSNSSEEMPAFWTIDVVANFRISENARAFVSVLNATDEAYALAAYEYGYSQAWYTARGRTIRAGIEIRF